MEQFGIDVFVLQLQVLEVLGVEFVVQVWGVYQYCLVWLMEGVQEGIVLG